MSDKNIETMDFRELRKLVRTLNDDLVRMKRNYEDILYNLDDSNFSQQIVKEQNAMRTQITIAAGKIKTMVSQNDLKGELEKYSTIEQTAEAITSTVTEKFVTGLVGDLYVTNATLYSEIEQTSDEINLRINGIVEGEHTGEMLEKYLSGIEIKPDYIKMVNGNVYSVYSSEGLKFYDDADQVEGWAIEPDDNYGGTLNYYKNNGVDYSFGTGVNGSGYSTSDMVLKATEIFGGGFAVDVTGSMNPKISFVGLNEQTTYSPDIYANGDLLATQSWVLANAGTDGSGISIAVFG